MKPVIKECAYALVHVPDMVRYGSKPFREIEKDQNTLQKIEENLIRDFNLIIDYPPHQAFIGNIRPEKLREIPSPWYKNLIPLSSRWGKFGEIMMELEFYGLLKMADIPEYEMVYLEKNFVSHIKEVLKYHPLFTEADRQKIGEGKSLQDIEKKLDEGKWWSLPLFYEGKLIGCFNRAKDPHAKEDEALGPHSLMESLVAKASGALALKHLIKRAGINPEDIDYILNCSEEAVGDRYNRGGGSLAKAIGEMCGCLNATGPDIKAFCVSPIYAIIIAGMYIKSGVAKKVAVVGGGCLAKLGMKFQGHLDVKMPIIEDALASAAFLITPDDKKSPIIRLDAIGKNSIRTGGSQQAVFEAVVLEPVKKIGKKIIDIDKYGVQLENPDITIPAKSGDAATNYYNMIATLAVMNNEISAKDMQIFREKHGMPGFAPTQGHIPAAIPYIGHAMEAMENNEIKTALFVARGSLFLGRMSGLYDGVSFILEKNQKQRRKKKCLKAKNS